MPAALAHYLLAKRLMQSEGIHIKLGNPNAFLWGAQGPDLFYCHRFLPWQKGESLREYGIKLHQAPAADTILSLHECDKEINNPILHDYVLGFLCHYALDSVAHPFIRYSAYMLHQLVEPSTLETCHHTVESMLDVIILRHERSALPTEINLKQLVPRDEAVKEAIARLYAAFFSRQYGAEISASLLKQCAEDCRTAFGWMTDRTSLKKQWISRREKKKNRPPTLSCRLRSMTEEDDFDYANILSGEWRWPLECGPSRTDSFFELFDQAEELARVLIQAYNSDEPLTQRLGASF